MQWQWRKITYLPVEDPEGPVCRIAEDLVVAAGEDIRCYDNFAREGLAA